MEIINIDITNIDKLAVKKIYDMVSVYNSSVAIDLKCVKTCVAEFFMMLSSLKNKASLVNVDSTILATLYMTGYDKYVRVFEDNLSLSMDKYEIIKRRFVLL